MCWSATSCRTTPGNLPRATRLIEWLDARQRTKQIVVDRADRALRALRSFENGKADFADCLIERTAAAAGCKETMTFDADAARHAGMALIR
jgi:predicted nucleic-acid-binding protein